MDLRGWLTVESSFRVCQLSGSDLRYMQLLGQYLITVSQDSRDNLLGVKRHNHCKVLLLPPRYHSHACWKRSKQKDAYLFDLGPY